jgi:hypothetical protein
MPADLAATLSGHKINHLSLPDLRLSCLPKALSIKVCPALSGPIAIALMQGAA